MSDGLGKGALFVVTIVAARRLSPEAFGLFSVASTLGWILAVASDCGIQLHLAREVASEPAAAEPAMRRWLRVRLRSSAVVAAILVGGVALAHPPLNVAAALLLIGAAYLTSGLLEFFYYFCRGVGRSDIESSLTIAHRLAMLPCAIAALLLFQSVVALGAALLGAAVLALGLALRVVRRIPTPRAGVASDLAVASPKEFVSDVLPIGLAIALSALYFRIDVFLVDRWIGAAAAGSYNAVFRLVEALRLFPAAVLAVMLPSLFGAADDRPLVQVASGVTLLGTGIAAAGLAASAWLVPALYGDAYAAAVPTFRLLLLSFPLFSLNYALTHQLIGWNGHRAYLGICALALAANLSLNAVLIPADGIDGAAWATFWTELLLTGCCAWKLSLLAPERVRRVAAAAGI